MAGYFSNHSQSRFLANSTTTSVHTTTTPNPPQVPRPRAPSSKHFSTFVSSPSEEKSQNKDRSAGNGSPNGVAVHPLRHTWVFWFRQQRAPGNKITSYEEGIKKISAFSSIESFWSLWTHLNPPSSLLPTTDYLLFHSGIRRPVWEDPLNLSGGKWIIRLRKGVADRLWEDLVLAILGDQFADCAAVDDSPFENASDNHKPEENGSGNGSNAGGDTAAQGDWPEICGCTISVRQNEDIISVWNRYEAEARVKEKIKETIRRVLNLPPTTTMEYKSNNDSMQDKSSFRVLPVDCTPVS
ncbi:hypothetical protein AcV5_009425 [Taiwanofungus camphoratus]|nr:hypothetical protein AcV5_009425 [Antrodia cinnamomea]